MDIDKIKKFFVWIFTLVGLILMIIGSVGLLNVALKKYVFTKADRSYCVEPLPTAAPGGKPVVTDRDAYLKNCKEQEESQRQRDMAQHLAFLIVGTPIFIGFFRKTK